MLGRVALSSMGAKTESLSLGGRPSVARARRRMMIGLRLKNARAVVSKDNREAADGLKIMAGPLP